VTERQVAGPLYWLDFDASLVPMVILQTLLSRIYLVELVIRRAQD